MPPAKDKQPIPDKEAAAPVKGVVRVAYQPDEKKPDMKDKVEKDPLEARLTPPDVLLLGSPLPRLADLEVWGMVIIPSELREKLPDIGKGPRPVPGPDGRPLTLSDLQRLARLHSPLLYQAKAAVEVARGNAIQAGAYPNPTIRHEQDTVNTAGTPTYWGGGIEQLIKTGNKLPLMRAAATMDYMNAELALRRAETDLATNVRKGYFSVLVAQENMRINEAIVQFTEEVYRIQLRRLKSGLSAAQEPAQMLAVREQSRVNLEMVREHYRSSWRQLAATLGLRDMPATELAGTIHLPTPVFDYDRIQAHVLQYHTDVLTAENTLLKSRYNLRLAQVTPIPDVDVATLLQKDHTAPPFNVTYSIQVSLPIPLWDRNQGGIIAAQAGVLQAARESDRARNALVTNLAIAFENYEGNRVGLLAYREKVIPFQIAAFTRLVRRYLAQAGAPDPNPETPTPFFLDLFSAQKDLIASLNTYSSTLDTFWQSVISVVDLLQTDDLFGEGGGIGWAPCVPTPQTETPPQPRGDATPAPKPDRLPDLNQLERPDAPLVTEKPAVSLDAKPEESPKPPTPSIGRIRPFHPANLERDDTSVPPIQVPARPQ
jgi:cobalt-zinc-cadmium efflux system outer membrane protein